ncbi:MAG: peptidylprolyl isomerase [Rhodospirillaceae bacterium]
MVKSRRFTILHTLVVGGVLAAILAAGAHAQSVQRIAAIVNDDVISAYDLQTRLQLVLFSTRLSDTVEVRQRISPQILRTLIDERLQIQEAQRRNISVSQRDISAAIESIEKQNNIPPGQLDEFLSRNGVPKDAMMSQVRANIAWNKLLGRQLRPRITIGEDEIDEVLERIRSQQGQTEYRIGEISLAVDSPDEEASVRTTAERIADQVAQGARFDAIARQFSQSATAAVGGDLGWMHESELDPTLREIVSEMQVGSISKPIKTVSGYRIVLLQNTRKIAHADASEVTVELQQVYLPFPAQAADADIESQIDLAKTIQTTTTGCPDFARLATEVGSSRPPGLGKFELGKLAPQIRSVVEDLPAGQISDPVKTPDGVLLLMVCAREGGVSEAKLPERDEIADQLLQERLSLMARRYLRDIRLSAVVDIRI